MSSMLLLKDHDGKRKGDVLSVPFGRGRELIRDGVAVYWDGGKGVKPVNLPKPAEPTVKPAPVAPAKEPSKPKPAEFFPALEKTPEPAKPATSTHGKADKVEKK